MRLNARGQPDRIVTRAKVLVSFATGDEGQRYRQRMLAMHQGAIRDYYDRRATREGRQYRRSLRGRGLGIRGRFRAMREYRRQLRAQGEREAASIRWEQDEQGRHHLAVDYDTRQPSSFMIRELKELSESDERHVYVGEGSEFLPNARGETLTPGAYTVEGETPAATTRLVQLRPRARSAPHEIHVHAACALLNAGEQCNHGSERADAIDDTTSGSGTYSPTPEQEFQPQVELPEPE